MTSEPLNSITSQLKDVTVDKNQQSRPKAIPLHWYKLTGCNKARVYTYVELQRLIAANNLVVVHGKPRVGKTEFVRVFVNLYTRDELPIWIHAETPETIQQSFDDLAKSHELQTTDVSQIYDHFKRSCFVFDAADNMASIEQYLPSSGKHRFVKVLITSRFSEWDVAAKIHLTALDLDSALGVFKAKLGDIVQKYPGEIWLRIVESLHGIPLCIELVSTMIYQKLQRVSTVNLEEFVMNVDSDEIIEATVKAAINQFEEEEAHNCLSLLCCVGYMDPEDICQRDLYFSEFNDSLKECLDKLNDCGLIRFNKTNNKPKIKNYLREDPFKEDKKSEIIMYPTVQLVLREYDFNKRNAKMFIDIFGLTIISSATFQSGFVLNFLKEKQYFDKTIEHIKQHGMHDLDYLYNFACLHCDEILQAILPDLKKNYKTTFEYKSTLNGMLLWAVSDKNDNLKTIQLLLKYGAKLETDDFERDPLSFWHSLELIDTILKSTIPANCKDPFNYKSDLKYIILRSLIKTRENKAQNVSKTMECINHLVSNWNVNILCQDKDSNNILHLACSNSSCFELIKMLIEKYNLKSLVNAQNKQKETPLHNFYSHYCRKDFEALCYFLKECDADIFIQDVRKQSGFFCICRVGSLESIDFVLRTKDCTQIMNDQDETGDVAFAAIICNSRLKEQQKIALIDVFLENKMDIYVKNYANETLLQVCDKLRRFFNLSVVLEKYLLKNTST